MANKAGVTQSRVSGAWVPPDKVTTENGSEITDASRLAAVAWAANKQGGSVDGYGVYKVTNLLPNGGFEANITGYTTTGPGVTAIVRDTAKAAFGVASLRADCDGTGTAQGVHVPNVAAAVGQIWSKSIYVWAPNGATMEVVLSERDAGGTALGLNSNTQFTGNGAFQRVVVTRTLTGPTVALVSISVRTTLTGQAISFWIDGIQYEQSPSANAYVDTNGAIAAAAQGTPDSSYGLWEAGINLFRRGQADATTDYTQTGGGVVTFAVDASVPSAFSPQMIKVTTDGGALNQGVHTPSNVGQAAAAGTWGVGSCRFLGQPGQSYQVWLRWSNTDTSSTEGTPTTIVGTGAIQYLEPIALAVAAGKTGDRLGIRVTINGTRAESFWISNVMTQKGVAVVGPYIATSGGTTATRVNNGGLAAPASLLTNAQGWIAARIRVGWSDATITNNAFNPRVFAWNTDTNNRLLVLYNRGGSKQFSFNCIAGGVQQNKASTALGSVSRGDYITVVAYWTGNTIGISINGGAFATLTGVTLPTLTDATFGIGNEQSNNPLNGNVMWFMAGVGTLTNADAATLFALGNTDPTLKTLGVAARTTFADGLTDSTYSTPTLKIRKSGAWQTVTPRQRISATWG